MSLKESIKKAFEEIDKLSDEEFERELEKHSNGDIAIALIENGFFILPNILL